MAGGAAYKPVLIGVRHEKPFLNRVRAAIVEHATPGGRIALEIPAGKHVPFWSELKEFAERKGFEVVPIDSRFAHDVALKKSFDVASLKAGSRAELDAERAFDYITLVLRTDFMRKRIKKERPGVIVVGANHARLLKEKIPVRKHVEVVDKGYEFDRRRYEAVKKWRKATKKGFKMLMDAAERIARGEKS